ncbi:MAG: hypothetical protein ABSE77_14945 [Acidimicrobiales bacterium]
MARQARLDAVTEANQRHVRTAQPMLAEVEAAIPMSAAALCKNPNALEVWAQAAIRIERHALGMADMREHAPAGGDPAPAVRVDAEARDIVRFLRPEQAGGSGLTAWPLQEFTPQRL